MEDLLAWPATSKSAWAQAAEVAFNICEHPHLDPGYAVTSHSSTRADS